MGKNLEGWEGVVGNDVTMNGFTYTGKHNAIVCFGPATSVTGMAPGHYYQVVIDPSMCSPTGEYIRFGAYQGDEINGWQRVAAITVVEDLGASDAKWARTEMVSHPGYTEMIRVHVKPDGYTEQEGASVTIRTVE